MNLNATIAKINHQNEDIAHSYRELRKQQIQIVSATVGFAIGFAAVLTYKIMSNHK